MLHTNEESREVSPHARIADDVSVASDVSVGAGAVIEHGATIEAGVTIGANAVIVAGVTVGSDAVVRPGAIVYRQVPQNAIVAGNPATISGYVDSAVNDHATVTGTRPSTSGIIRSSVRDVTYHTFPVVEDLRGSLTVGDFGTQVPFVPQRYFMVFDVPNAEVRGEHAHWECHQFLMCVEGTLTVLVDDGTSREEFVLSDRFSGVYLPPLTWGIQYRYSSDAVLLAFASHPYDPDDYIRDYSEFLTAVAKRDA